MFVLVFTLILAQTGPGPLDGYRANRAAIRVRVESLFETGKVAPEVLDDRLWDPGTPSPIIKPGGNLACRWEADGPVEHFVCEPKGSSVGELPSERRPVVEGTIAFEELFNGQVSAYHFLHESVLTVKASEQLMLATEGAGPFLWTKRPLDELVTTEFGETAPIRKLASRGGRPVEVEIYRTPIRRPGGPGGWLQLEVYYDPSVGYLPRYARAITRADADGGKAWVNEFYLTEARPCRAGGFIPIEWYSAVFGIDDFDESHPDYEDGSPLTPNHSAYLKHYKCNLIVDLTTPIELDRLERTRVLLAGATQVAVRPGTKSLSLATIKKVAATSSKPAPTPGLPNVDTEELDRFRHDNRPAWPSYLGWGLVAIAAFLVLIALRRWRIFILLPLSFTTVGCAPPTDPAAHLTASFTPECLVIDSPKAAVPIALTITNEGHQAVRLFGVDGGCSCRQVDRSPLPVILRPGQNLRLNVLLRDRQDYEPGLHSFRCETDHGGITVQARLQVLPRHRLCPDSVVSHALGEHESWQIDLVHREIYPTNVPREEIRLVAPVGFLVEEIGTTIGSVAGASGYSFCDSSFRVTLQERSLGLQKGVLAARRTDGAELIEAPILWNRLPYLSSVPERVVLGPRPCRVFLRCVDENVELTAVLSAPEGVNAVVSSTRELTLRLASDAPGIVDGICSGRHHGRTQATAQDSCRTLRSNRGALTIAALTVSAPSRRLLPSLISTWETIG